MVKTELKRAFCSKPFWVTCGITLVMLAPNNLQTGIHARQGSRTATKAEIPTANAFALR